MATTRKRRPPLARGAVIQRGLVKRWSQRQIRQIRTQPQTGRTLGYTEALLDLQQWLREQPERAQGPGGIGR